MKEDAPQREHSLREVFNGLRYIVRTGMQWRMMPNDLPPWHTVYQQTQRWLRAGVFEDMVRDLRPTERISRLQNLVWLLVGICQSRLVHLRVHDGIDILTSEVLAVVELVEIGRRRQRESGRRSDSRRTATPVGPSATICPPSISV